MTAYDDPDTTVAPGVTNSGESLNLSLDESQPTSFPPSTTSSTPSSTALSEEALSSESSTGGLSGFLPSQEESNNLSTFRNGEFGGLANSDSNFQTGSAIGTGTGTGTGSTMSPVGGALPGNIGNLASNALPGDFSSSSTVGSSTSGSPAVGGAVVGSPAAGSSAVGGAAEGTIVGNNGSSGTGLPASATGPNSQSNGLVNNVSGSSTPGQSIAPGQGSLSGVVPLTGGDSGSIIREFPFSRWTATNTYFEPNVPTEGGVSPFPYFPRGTPYYQPTANKKSSPNKSLLAAAIISLISGLLLVSAFTAFIILRRRRQMALYIERDFGNLSNREAALPENASKSLPLPSVPPQIAPIQRMSNLGGAVFPLVIPATGDKLARIPSGVMPGEETHSSLRIPPAIMPTPTIITPDRKPLSLASSQYLAAPKPQTPQQMQSLRNAKRLSRPINDGESTHTMESTPRTGQVEQITLPSVVSAAAFVVPAAAIVAPVPRRRPVQVTESEERIIEEDFARELAMKRHLTSTPIEDEEMEEEEEEGRGGFVAYMDEEEHEEQSFSATAAALIKSRVEESHKHPREVIEEVYEYEEEEDDDRSEAQKMATKTTTTSQKTTAAGLTRREKIEVFEIEEEEEETRDVVSSGRRVSTLKSTAASSMQSRARSGTMSSSQSRGRSGTESSQASRVVQSEIVEEYFIEEEVTASDSEEETEPKIVEEIVVQDDRELQAYFASIGINPMEQQSAIRTPSSAATAISRPQTGATVGTTFTSDSPTMHERKKRDD